MRIGNCSDNGFPHSANPLAAVVNSTSKSKLSNYKDALRNVELILMSYSMLSIFSSSVEQKYLPLSEVVLPLALEFVVYDEGHQLGGGGKQHQHACVVPCHRRVLVTATLINNNSSEYTNLLDLLQLSAAQAQTQMTRRKVRTSSH